MRLIFLSFLCIVVGLVKATGVGAAEHDDVGGLIVAQLAGQDYVLPMLNSDVSINIEGDMATVEITQTFLNEAHLPMQAEYLFPLNQMAAVYGMEMVVGDEIITAEIQEKAQAEATFKAAADEGKAAVLLTQHRPNMFTQNIANLMPGLPIEVTLRYVQMVPKIDKQHELVIPLVVGPRYTGENIILPEIGSVSDPEPLPENIWSISDLPAHPPLIGRDIPKTFEAERVSLSVDMVSGLTLKSFESPTHTLAIETTDDGVTATFADGRVLDNKDLIIRYALGGETLEAASLSHIDERGGFLSVMIEPPAVPDETMITPRELVFVLDTSGSMGGAPMDASKRFMDAALAGLRVQDYFRIIPFSNTAQSYSDEAQLATLSNVRKARDFVDRLGAGGGTEIDNAIRTAFATRQPENTMRIVVFLSDGYIGNEARVLRTLNQQIGQARVYAFGVGNSVNRYLLDAMADEGRGYARYVPAGEDADDIAEALARDLKTPVLTDISIDWGDLDVRDVSPSRIPDLFAGQSLRVYARHTGDKAAQISVKGLMQGRPAEMPVPLSFGRNDDVAALPLIWARNRIAALRRDVALGQNARAADAEITRLGLAFSLQTKNTSFVAVSKKRVNTTGQPATPVSVPLSQPAPAPVGGFSGSSTPEPEAIFGFLIFAMMSIFGLRRRAA